MSPDEHFPMFTAVPADPDVSGTKRTREWVLREFGKRWTAHDRQVVAELVTDYGVDDMYTPPKLGYVTCRKDHVFQFWIEKGRVQWVDPEDPNNAGKGVPPSKAIRDTNPRARGRYYLPLSTVSHHEAGNHPNVVERDPCPQCFMVHAVAQTECD